MTTTNLSAAAMTLTGFALLALTPFAPTAIAQDGVIEGPNFDAPDGASPNTVSTEEAGVDAHNNPVNSAGIRDGNDGGRCYENDTCDGALSCIAGQCVPGCNGGSPEDCLALAERYYSGDGLEVDYTEWFRLMRIACDRGNAEGCTAAGDAYYVPIGVDVDLREAVRYYGYACEGGVDEACAAVEMIERTCALGYEETCDGIVEQDAGHDDDTVPDDDASGDATPNDEASGDATPNDASDDAASDSAHLGGVPFALDSRAGSVGVISVSAGQDGGSCYEDDTCDPRLACVEELCVPSCVTAPECTLLGHRYLVGEGVAQNSDIAWRLYRTACEQGDPEGCYQVAVMYSVGEGVERNIRQSVRHYRSACHDGYAVACDAYEDTRALCDHGLAEYCR